MRCEDFGLALIPGPLQIPQPYSSINVQEITEYPAEKIVQSLLSIEGTELLSKDITSLWQWRAQYSSNGNSLVLEMTCMGDKDEIWGGFLLAGSFEKDAILSLWNALTSMGYSAIWLHDHECNIYTKERFLLDFSD